MPRPNLYNCPICDTNHGGIQIQDRGHCDGYKVVKEYRIICLNCGVNTGWWPKQWEAAQTWNDSGWRNYVEEQNG